MKLPAIHGIIDRRILINFSASPEVVAKLVPPPFKPKLYNGKAIVGICLIRLKNIKPKGLPRFIGVNSENGAHRIAVEWEEDGVLKEGVYIPRRDTSLWLNAFLGGRFFPGKHHLARFNVRETNDTYHVDFTSSDNTRIAIDAKVSAHFNPASIFRTLDNASGFFEQGSVGYSPNGSKFEGLRLITTEWKVTPLDVTAVSSSFFENEALFPKGSVQFDNALLMRKIEHQWLREKDK